RPLPRPVAVPRQHVLGRLVRRAVLVQHGLRALPGRLWPVLDDLVHRGCLMVCHRVLPPRGLGFGIWPGYPSAARPKPLLAPTTRLDGDATGTCRRANRRPRSEGEPRWREHGHVARRSSSPRTPTSTG